MATAAPLPLAVPPARGPDTHKGSYGHVLVVAGSRRYPGAAILTALGAGRAGAGLVELALPWEIVPVVLPAVPYAVVTPMAATAEGGLAAAAAPEIVAAASRGHAVALGPGLGQEPETARLVPALLEELTCPLVVDADGLNALAATNRAEVARAIAAQERPVVLTPHPAECARLDGGPVPRGDDERIARARALAEALGAIVVLKGHRTVVTDGARVRVETAGNPGMATGGMGDVLTGVVAALLARRAATAERAASDGSGGDDPRGRSAGGQDAAATTTAPTLADDAATTVALAVHVHARAGDLAAADLGQESVLPTDVAERLGKAVEALVGDRPV